MWVTTLIKSGRVRWYIKVRNKGVTCARSRCPESPNRHFKPRKTLKRWETHFYSFLLEKSENRIPWCICQSYGVCEKFETNFQSLDLGALGRGRPAAKLYEFREHMSAYRGSLSIEKISICTRLGETRAGTSLPGPPNKCSIFPFLQYNYIIIFLKNQIGWS